MDYEKKYKEALERMKIWVNEDTPDDFFDTHEVHTFVFPELAESEDEKVREDIISLVNEFWEKIGSINPEYSSRSRMLAWLEKQGESYTKRDVDDAYLKGISDAKNELEKQGEQKQYDIDVLEKHITKDSISELAHTVIVRNGWEIVDAKEQNPVWSEEDEEHYKACLQCFEVINPDMVYYKDYLWLISLKQRIGG